MSFSKLSARPKVADPKHFRPDFVAIITSDWRVIWPKFNSCNLQFYKLVSYYLEKNFSNDVILATALSIMAFRTTIKCDTALMALSIMTLLHSVLILSVTVLSDVMLRDINSNECQ